MQLLVKSLFLLTLLVAGTTNAWSADGRILSFEGDVRVNGKPVTANTVLNREDTIVTAAGALVKIVLADNSVLDIDSDSKIKLSEFNYNPAAPKENKSDISVVEGTLRYVSGLIAKEDPDDIGFTAGNSTIGVRGSFTGIEVDGVTVNVEAMIGEDFRPAIEIEHAVVRQNDFNRRTRCCGDGVFPIQYRIGSDGFPINAHISFKAKYAAIG